ncbi:MAG: hypothetical protein M1819_000745 [Sarea resinae]|nr:MAG: hypothetical protein M1819_000745 [Sarea resinae]
MALPTLSSDDFYTFQSSPLPSQLSFPRPSDLGSLFLTASRPTRPTRTTRKTKPKSRHTPKHTSIPKPSPFPFLRLPSELRIKIYRFALVDKEPLDLAFDPGAHSRSVQIGSCRLSYGTRLDTNVRSPFPLALFRAAKQLHAEASTVFYEENTFRFVIMASALHDGFPEGPASPNRSAAANVEIRSSLDLVAPTYLARLRRVSVLVRIRLNNRPGRLHVPYLEEQLAMFAHRLMSSRGQRQGEGRTKSLLSVEIAMRDFVPLPNRRDINVVMGALEPLKRTQHLSVLVFESRLKPSGMQLRSNGRGWYVVVAPETPSTKKVKKTATKALIDENDVDGKIGELSDLLERLHL